MFEERHHDAFQSEAQACGVRNGSILRADFESLAKMLAMEVERADGGGVFL
jgi:hypothetical protein